MTDLSKWGIGDPIEDKWGIGDPIEEKWGIGKPAASQYGGKPVIGGAVAPMGSMGGAVADESLITRPPDTATISAQETPMWLQRIGKLLNPSEGQSDTAIRATLQGQPQAAALMNLGRKFVDVTNVPGNAAIEFAQGKPFTSQSLGVGKDVPTTGNEKRDNEIRMASDFAGLLTGMTGLDVGMFLRTVLKGEKALSAALKAGATAEDAQKLARALPAPGEGTRVYERMLAELPATKPEVPVISRKGDRYWALNEAGAVEERMAKQAPITEEELAKAIEKRNEYEALPDKIGVKKQPKQLTGEVMPQSEIEKLPTRDEYREASALEHQMRMRNQNDLFDSLETARKLENVGPETLPETQQVLERSKQLKKDWDEFRGKALTRMSAEQKLSPENVFTKEKIGGRAMLSKEPPKFTGDASLMERAAKHDAAIYKEAAEDPWGDSIKTAIAQDEAYKRGLPITEKLNEQKKKIYNLAQEDGTVKARVATSTRFRSADNWLVDNGGEEIVDFIHTGARQNDAWRHNQFKKVQATLEGITEDSEEAQQLGLYLKPRLWAEGQTFSPKIKRVGENIKTQILRPIMKELQSSADVKQYIGNIGDLGIDYFPEMERAMTTRFGEETAKRILHDLKPAGLKSGFFKSRKLAKDPEMDAVKVLRSYVNGTAKTMFDVPAYAKAMEKLKTLPAGPDDIFGDIASSYVKNFVGQPTTTAQVRAWEKLPSKINQWYYRSYIGANPMSALRNLSQSANTYIATGTKNFVKGVKALFEPSAEVNRLFEETGMLSEFSGMDVAMEGLKKQGFMKKFDNTIYYMFRKAEEINRKIAFASGYFEGMEKFGNDTQKAVNHALDVVHRTQFTYGKVSPTGISHMKLQGQFTNYPIKQLEFMLSTLKNPAEKRRMLALLGVVGAYETFDNREELMQAVSDLKQKKFGKAAVGLGMAALRGTTEAVPGPAPFARDIVGVASAPWSGRYGKPSDYLLELAKRTPGVGGVTQTGKRAVDWLDYFKGLGD